MSPRRPLRVVILKPSKYAEDGCVERFRRGFMPNSTITHLASLTPPRVAGAACSVETVDEYVHTDLGYLDRLRADPSRTTLLALVGVQSLQLHRALDLAAFARARGVEHCVLGGPHPMTCDTAELHGCGAAFALAEAELVWPAILKDAAAGELAPVYGGDRRWQARLDPPLAAGTPEGLLRLPRTAPQFLADDDVACSALEHQALRLPAHAAIQHPHHPRQLPAGPGGALERLRGPHLVAPAGRRWWRS